VSLPGPLLVTTKRYADLSFEDGALGDSDAGFGEEFGQKKVCQIDASVGAERKSLFWPESTLRRWEKESKKSSANVGWITLPSDVWAIINQYVGVVAMKSSTDLARWAATQLPAMNLGFTLVQTERPLSVLETLFICSARYLEIWGKLPQVCAIGLQNAIKNSKSLVGLKFHPYVLDPSLTPFLATALERNLSIRFVVISCNTGILELSAMVGVNSGLRDLNLTQGSIDCRTVKAICSGLLRNSTLTCLNISHNHAGPGCGVFLSDVLKYNHTLRKLDISGNNLGSEAISLIAESLKVNKTLVELDISKNACSATVGRKIACVLRENNTLEKLGLVDCSSESKNWDDEIDPLAEDPINDQLFGQVLFSTLEVNRTLNFLRLSPQMMAKESRHVLFLVKKFNGVVRIKWVF